MNKNWIGIGFTLMQLLISCLPHHVADTISGNPEFEEIPTTNVNKTAHGVISEDEIWLEEFHIIGDIKVLEGVTLTIEPGTNITIAANSDYQNLFSFDREQGIQTESENINGVHFGEPYRDEDNHISIIIEGTLHAVGTPDQIITIKSDSENPDIYDWNRFEFAHGTLSYCEMEYYRILSPGNDTLVSHNILRNIGECGVCANSTVLVEKNKISYAGHELIDMHNSSPEIVENHLGPNPEHCGIIVDGGSPRILNNTIEGCVTGIGFISSPESPILEGNIFINNSADIEGNY